MLGGRQRFLDRQNVLLPTAKREGTGIGPWPGSTLQYGMHSRPFTQRQERKEKKRLAGQKLFTARLHFESVGRLLLVQLTGERQRENIYGGSVPNRTDFSALI